MNDNSHKDTLGIGYFNFPSVDIKNCNFLLKEERKPYTSIGPNYGTEYGRYSKIPFVDNDTLIHTKGKIIWVNANRNNQVVGYYVFM